MSEAFLEEGADIFDDDILNEPLWDRKTTARFLRVTPETLAVWDCTKRYDLGPIKFGRSVRYRPSKVKKFLEEQMQKRQIL